MVNNKIFKYIYSIDFAYNIHRMFGKYLVWHVP